MGMPNFSKPWRAVEPQEAAENSVMAVNALTGETKGLVPRAMVEGDDGEEMTVMCDVYEGIGRGLWFTHIVVPGPCGHYRHGGVVTYCHN